MLILGLSGRKQSGKNSLADFLVRNTAELFPHPVYNQKVKCFGFASALKDVCCDLFGVPRNWAYGDDEAKRNTTNAFTLSGSPLTVRGLLQYFGTDVVRAMHYDAWVNAAMAGLARVDGVHLAVFTDVRFPNEVAAIKSRGGKVIRLTRSPANWDGHESEVALDMEKYDWGNFDSILDNKGMTVAEQNQGLVSIMRGYGWVPVRQSLEGMQ